MKKHSFVDAITNSSSSVYIAYPKDNVRNIASYIGLDDIEINLSRKYIEEGIRFKDYHITDFLDEKTNNQTESLSLEEAYNILNKAFKNGEFGPYTEVDIYETWSIENTMRVLDIKLVTNSGQYIDLYEVVDNINKLVSDKNALS